MDNDTNTKNSAAPSNVRRRVNSLHDSNKGVAWIISTLVTILLGGGAIYKIFSTPSSELERTSFISGNNNTVVLSQPHTTATNILQESSLFEGRETSKPIMPDPLYTPAGEIDKVKDLKVTPPILKTQFESPPHKQTYVKPTGNLLSNGDLSSYYEPAWESYRKNNGFSRINYVNQMISLSYSGEGNGEKEVSVQQTVLIETTEDLVFSTTIKVFDRNEIGYAVTKLSLLDNTRNELFHFSITPDSFYESTKKHELVLIPFDNKKLIRINIGERIKSKLSINRISSIKYITVSYEITPTIHTRCKRCSIDVFDSQLFYGKEKT